jgi:serine/threonine protein kinase
MQDAEPASVDNSSLYELRYELGKGAFGKVYLAQHRRTRLSCVLKKIRGAKQTTWQQEASRQEMKMVSIRTPSQLSQHLTTGTANSSVLLR